ncbi:N-acetylmuramate alpha-1-phosphate uridylyltransferase MurU [Candidatus Pelagadaptatus aseana]|uniref:N-acetylmuramate alpha-1-phosphate uridylyltransferase MurU n=1 Tax=Candidatus Pelagadaptatus aseana TaxID=3120508 RepID=UPI003C6EFA51
MILAAGLGKRMRPLTDYLPKPLLPVAGRPLIEHHLMRLQAAGVREVIINIAHLGHLVRESLGDGSRFGLSIEYSEEGKPLETGGAINRVLSQLGEDPFLLINGDVWTDCDLRALIQSDLPEACLGHLLLVPNPDHCEQGNFCFREGGDGVLQPLTQGCDSFTFSGVSVLRPQLIADFPERREYFPLREAFFWAMDQGRLRGEVFTGHWVDVGTPERLQQLDRLLSQGD